jgi:hypothetical protein
VAYGKQKMDDVKSFANLLKANRFELHFGNTPWNIAMALKAAEILPNVDAIVLGTAYNEAGRILNYAADKGKIATCFAANVPGFFRQFCRIEEITEDLLATRNETSTSTKQMVVPPDGSGNGNGDQF